MPENEILGAVLAAAALAMETSCQAATASGRRHAFDDDDVGPGCLLAQASRRRVLGRIYPCLRLLDRRELEDHETLRRPVTFDFLDGAAAREKLSAVLRNRRGRKLLVVLEQLWVRDFHVVDHVCG